MFALSSYNMLLQELTNTVAPLAPKSSALARAAPPPEAVAAVRKELMRRETEIQLAILGTTPLMRFANAEVRACRVFSLSSLAEVDPVVNSRSRRWASRSKGARSRASSEASK